VGHFFTPQGRTQTGQKVNFSQNLGPFIEKNSKKVDFLPRLCKSPKNVHFRGVRSTFYEKSAEAPLFPKKSAFWKSHIPKINPAYGTDYTQYCAAILLCNMSAQHVAVFWMYVFAWHITSTFWNIKSTPTINKQAGYLRYLSYKTPSGTKFETDPQFKTYYW